MTAKTVIISAILFLFRARFRTAVYRVAEEEEDGADEGSGVGDAHPEDEVGDEVAPVAGPLQAGEVEAVADDEGVGPAAKGGERGRRRQQQPVAPPRPAVGGLYRGLEALEG